MPFVPIWRVLLVPIFSAPSVLLPSKNVVPLPTCESVPVPVIPLLIERLVERLIWRVPLSTIGPGGRLPEAVLVPIWMVPEEIRVVPW